MATKTREAYQDAKTGKFIKKEQAKKHPNTTIKHNIKVPTKKTK